MEILPLEAEHLQAAAELFVQGYRRQLECTPDLPARHAQPESLLPKMRELIAENPGVAAWVDGRLAGYLSGYLLGSFMGSQKGVHIPEWGHAAVGEGRPALYQQMYTALSAQWVRDGFYNHAITLLAEDEDLRQSFFWSSFGLIVIDAIRPLDPVAGLPRAGPETVIRQAVEADLDAFQPLSDEHNRYYAQAPVFLSRDERQDRPFFEEWLAQPDRLIWLAFVRGRMASFILTLPSSTDACTIISDERTLSIVGAYTLPEFRGRGLAALLLSEIVAWAKLHQYQRLSVDFESANPPARHFWLKHFRPVAFSLLRKVDDRIRI